MESRRRGQVQKLYDQLWAFQFRQRRQFVFLSGWKGSIMFACVSLVVYVACRRCNVGFVRLVNTALSPTHGLQHVKWRIDVRSPILTSSPLIGQSILTNPRSASGAIVHGPPTNLAAYRSHSSRRLPLLKYGVDVVTRAANTLIVSWALQ